MASDPECERLIKEMVEGVGTLKSDWLMELDWLISLVD